MFEFIKQENVNVSIMDENDSEFGTKVEVKNVNSFDAISYSTIYTWNGGTLVEKAIVTNP